jgi:hypothetical protein
VACFLCAEASAGACRWSAAETNQTLALVTHHKSGTYAARQLLTATCPFPRNALPESCATCGVHYKISGLVAPGAPDVPLARSPVDVILHFIRHPLDMLTSGYRYHKACYERLWTALPMSMLCLSRADVAIVWAANLTALFSRHVQGAQVGMLSSYWSMLQQLPTEQGLVAEALRAFASHGGIAQMLRDSARLAEAQKAIPRLTVVPMCMARYSPKTADAQMARREWQRAVNALGFPVSSLALKGEAQIGWHSAAADSHGTGSLELYRAASAAYDLALRALPHALGTGVLSALPRPAAVDFAQWNCLQRVCVRAVDEQGGGAASRPKARRAQAAKTAQRKRGRRRPASR